VALQPEHLDPAVGVKAQDVSEDEAKKWVIDFLKDVLTARGTQTGLQSRVAEMLDCDKSVISRALQDSSA